MICDMPTEYGSRLREARKDAKLTQEGLSKKTGIPQSTISTAEREGNGSGETPVYAEVCGVNALWLSTGKGPKYPRKDVDEPTVPSASIHPMELSPSAFELGMLYDMIPVTDRLRRAQAHVAASSAIIAVLEGHGIAVRAVDTKKQPG